MHNVHFHRNDEVRHCRCSCALTSSAHGWKQQQQSTNQKPRRNHVERYLKGVHFPCDDATAVPFLIQKNIRFLFSIRHLLHLCFARLDFKSRATTTTATQKAKANGLVCVAFKCPIVQFLSLSLSSRVCTFSDPSRLFDDFSGESNNHKKKKGKKKKKESRVMPSSWALWWASRTRFRVMEQDGTGIYDTCGLEKENKKQDSTWTSTRIATDVDRLIEFVNFFCFFLPESSGPFIFRLFLLLGSGP